MSAKFQAELDQLHADPDVMALLGGVYPSEISRKKIQESEDHWARHGFGLWCWFDKQTNDFVGRGGLRWQQLDNGQNIIEIAYMVHKRYWGKGFANEIASYCLDVGFNQFQFNEIVAIITPENTRSQKVAEKAGLIFDKEMVLFRGKPNLIARKKAASLENS